MNCNTTHYRANSSSVPGDPTQIIDTGPTVADTGPTVADAVETAHEHRREVWGRPGFCPKCGGRGYLDRIDVVDRIMYEHCTECFSKWSVAESDTESPAR